LSANFHEDVVFLDWFYAFNMKLFGGK